MKTINYTMTKNYRKNWNEIDAIREIIQNCLDNRANKSTYLLDEKTGEVVVRTEGYNLPIEALALGQSEKPDGAIGGFGEGFKLALMILSRSDCSPVVYNSGTIITPKFVFDETLGLELFTIDIDEAEGEHPLALEYSMTIDTELVKELKEKVNVFSDNILPLPNTVDVIEEKPGCVMVNGLHVCYEDKFRYGYNFAPHMIQLGCDRQIASSFGMAWETSGVWAERINESNADEVLNMISEGCLDVADIQYHISEGKAVLIANAFTRRFGHVKIKQVGSSLGYGIAVNGSLYNTMKKSGVIEVTNKYEEHNTPYSKIKKILESEKKHMRSRSYKALKALLEESKEW